MAPSAHANENPLLWSIDVAGGLHSRANAADRLALNPNWTQEGAIVYDASDKTYYTVGPELIATNRLFAATNGGFSMILPGDVVVASTNHAFVAGNHVDIIGTNDLNLDGAGQFTVSGLDASISLTRNVFIGGRGSLALDATNVVIRTNLAIQSPKVLAGQARVRQVWALSNTNGQGEWSDSEVGAVIVTNVAQLVLTPTGPATGYQNATTLGYYTINDGGGGTYYAHPIAGSTTNRGNFQSLYNTNYIWSLLQPRDGVYIKQYGAKGDYGATDDTPSFKDWLTDINGKVGILNVGIYGISSITNNPGDKTTIRGITPLGEVAGITPGGSFYYDNCAVLKRLPGTTASLINCYPSASSVFNLFNVVLDGNAAADSVNSANYLFFNLNGGPCTLRNVTMGNTAGHAVVIAASRNSLDTVQVFNCLGRGVRISGGNYCRFINGRIVNCGDNCLTIRSSDDVLVSNVQITDGGLNGIFLENQNNGRLHAVTVTGHKRTCVTMDIGVGNVYSMIFSECIFQDANCAVNLCTNVVASPSGTWPVVMTQGNNTAQCAQNAFVNCTLGWHVIDNRYGTNLPTTIFKWTATQQPGIPTWYNWRFLNNIYLPGTSQSGNLANYDPYPTNWVSEFGNLYTDLIMRTKFNRAGQLDSVDGFILHKAPATGGGDQALMVNDVTHPVTKQGAAIIPQLSSPLPEIVPPIKRPSVNPLDP